MTLDVDGPGPAVEPDDDPEVWYCGSCDEYRPLDGVRGYPCDEPRDCPNAAEWDGANCGYVVCGVCHAPLSDRHLAPGVTL
jgi:hypothetical protein